nr:hypothetical protein [Tanacetum cinerariifolium]
VGKGDFQSFALAQRPDGRHVFAPRAGVATALAPLKRLERNAHDAGVFGRKF